MSERYDAVVLGGGVNGVAAVALLAKAGLHALLLEPGAALAEPGGGATLAALDPRLVKALKLTRHGLEFAARDVPLQVLRPGAAPLVVGRDRHALARALSPADAAAFAALWRELQALARAMRPTWWEGRPGAQTAAALKPAQRALLERLSVTSAACFLAAAFESDALKTALAQAAAACGAAPSEPGSALALAWATAQEMNGLQGAVALPRGGVAGLLQALGEAAQAAGAQIRANAPPARIIAAAGAVTGVELLSGEVIAAPLVLSALPRRRTLGELLPPALGGLGAARALANMPAAAGAATLTFGLNHPPAFATAATRLLLAERLETYEAALAAWRLDEVPRELILELVLATSADAQQAGRPFLTVHAWPVAPSINRATLAAAVIAAIESHAAGFAASVASCDIEFPQARPPVTVERLLAGADAHIGTPLRGLLLCGQDAEPANAISGRAARHAAGRAIALHRKAR